MSADPVKDATPAAAPSKPETPEQAFRRLEGEVRGLEGRLKNANPVQLTEITGENRDLEARLGQLINAWIHLSRERMTPPDTDSLKYRTEVLRKTAVEYCQKFKIDQSLWKDIES